MRIPCPFCGARDSAEFTYLDDATYSRPDPEGTDVEKRFFEATYLRDNPAGLHHELWYHVSGCGSWLRVKRDTRTHEIFSVDLCKRQLPQ
jgi:methylglutamate dehydrogenase subunit B